MTTTINLPRISGKRTPVDLSEIISQEHAKRAIEVSAVSGANVLLIGTPGAGKSMLAEAYANLLGNGETTVVVSVSVSDTVKTLKKAIEDRDGNVTAIIADELPELKRDVLMYIKELSQGFNIPVIANMHSCPCGYLSDPRYQCTCTPAQISRYRSSIFGSLWELFDIHIEVPAVPVKELCFDLTGDGYKRETSEQVLSRVIPARERYKLNQDNLKPCNDAVDLLSVACQKLGFSARAVSKIIQIARAIADLDSETVIKAHHISEAIQYRTLDRHM